MSAAQESAITSRKARSYAIKVIEHHFGSKPKRVVARAGGLSNFVFEVHHELGDFIVRMNADLGKLKDFLKEQWAVTKASEAGVPTAKILEVGTDIIGIPYMILPKVAGLEATHHPERLRILREMGRLTALIHSVKTSSFGHTFDWSGNQLSRNENWREYLNTELKADARVQLLDQLKMLTGDQLKRLRSVVRQMERWDPTPVLNHGDMRLKNVIADSSGAITAVIDWECCASNVAPYWDLSLALHDLSVDAKQEFLLGYGLMENQVREMAPIIKAINIINYVPYVERAASDEDFARLEHYRTRLSGALDLYSL
ncbi:aminoglycoside phosphotransferase family protein [Methylocystis echinoides]|uniref:phosphotransferase family protein n=1 Tax=Methylocystis echinoides TaxID=29468 RepID=UPI003418F9AD